MVGGSSPGAGNRASQLGGGGTGPQPATGNRLFGPGVIGSDPTLGFDTDPAPVAGCGLPGARADEGGRYSAQGVSQVRSLDSAGHEPHRVCRRAAGIEGGQPSGHKADHYDHVWLCVHATPLHRYVTRP